MPGADVRQTVWEEDGLQPRALVEAMDQYLQNAPSGEPVRGYGYHRGASGAALVFARARARAHFEQKEVAGGVGVRWRQNILQLQSVRVLA